MELGQVIEYVGAEDEDLGLFRGHPGRVFLLRGLPESVYASFVNGPSLSCPVASLAPLSQATFVHRGERVVAGLHPLDERPIRRLMAPGHEWP